MDFPLDKPSGAKKRNRRHNIKAGNAETIRRATIISMVGMILAKLTGFMREMLLVPKFGYGIYSDAYINAFQIPDLIYELLIGGAVSAVLTPYLSAGIEKDREKEVWKSISIFISVTICCVSILLVLAEIFAKPLMYLITGAGKNPSESLLQMTAVSIPVTRILLLQTLFLTMVALTHGVLYSYKRITPVSMGPSVYNICYMTALILLGAPSAQGVKGVALGVVGSAAIYLFYQLFSARREWHWYRFSLDIQEPGFRRLLRLAIPTLISGSVLHINDIVMNRYANDLNLPGAVTSVRQCITTWSLPYAIFAVSIGAVMLPNLSGFVAQKNARKIRSLYTKSLRRALFAITPFAIIFAIMNFETIRAIFQWNPEHYTNAQVAQTGQLLRWFCVSMIAQTVVFMTNQAFYARRVTRLALITGLVALALNPLFCQLFMVSLGRGLEGLGMAHAAYSVVTAVILFSLYRRHREDWKPLRLLPFVIRLTLCGGVVATVAFALGQIPLFPAGKLLQLVYLAVKGCICLYAYYVAGVAFSFKEMIELRDWISEKFHLSNRKSDPYLTR